MRSTDSYTFSLRKDKMSILEYIGGIPGQVYSNLNEGIVNTAVNSEHKGPYSYCRKYTVVSVVCLLLAMIIDIMVGEIEITEKNYLKNYLGQRKWMVQPGSDI